MPRYRFRVSDGQREAILEESFRDEARLREQVPKRGWTQILSVEQLQEPPAAGASSTDPNGRNRLRAGLASGVAVLIGFAAMILYREYVAGPAWHWLLQEPAELVVLLVVYFLCFWIITAIMGIAREQVRNTNWPAAAGCGIGLVTMWLLRYIVHLDSPSWLPLGAGILAGVAAWFVIARTMPPRHSQKGMV
jgi:hypothetical protein